MIKILERLTLIIDTQQLSQYKKTKFRNAWPCRCVVSMPLKVFNHHHCLEYCIRFIVLTVTLYLLFNSVIVAPKNLKSIPDIAMERSGKI